MKPHIPTIIALSLGLAAAPAVELVVATDPAGPIAVGEEVTVRLSVSGWDASDPEVDAVAFNIDFDPTVLEFVTGSGGALDDGSEFLALANQGAGYNLGDDCSESLIAYGRYIFGAADTGDPSAGSIGPGGSLGSFRLLAVAPGTTKIETSTNSPSKVFSDPDFYGIDPTGGLGLGAVQVTVPDPGINYDRWAATIPFLSEADARPDADPDADGRKNTLEYFFDANPLVPDPDRSPVVGTVVAGGREYTTLTYERPAGALSRTDAKDQGERSIDLVNWRPDDVVVVSVSAIDPATGRETVVLRSTHPIGSLARDFLRLLVTLAP